MNPVRVHITFTPDVSADTEARAAVVAEITRVGGMVEVNQSRLERYGLLTGVIDATTLDAVRAIAGVRTVEPDRIRNLR